MLSFVDSTGKNAGQESLLEGEALSNEFGYRCLYQ